MAGRHIVVVGGGTSGSVMAARLSENPAASVTLLEAGPDHDAYDAAVLEPARASAAWAGAVPSATTPMLMEGGGSINMLQGRLLGGTSAVNGLATLRGLPHDYDGWAAPGSTAGVGTTSPARSSLRNEMATSATHRSTATADRSLSAAGVAMS